jgi:hypothetical protein
MSSTSEVGACVPTALDISYLRYSEWCAKLGYPAASYDACLRVERLGSGCALSKATGGIRGLTSYAESRKRMKKPPTLPIHSPSAPA